MLNAAKIIQKLNNAGYAAYIVGGAVRDHVMGREPNDYDIATNARPEQLREVFPEAPYVGKAYGIVLVDGIEVAPFRRDVKGDGRQAVVEFSDDIVVDLGRRDFTINAMAMNIERDIFDPFGGIEDLEANRLRFVGDAMERLEEDYLRAFRYARFAARFSMPLDREYVEMIRAEREEIMASVAKERVWAELKKSDGHMRDMIFNLHELGLLVKIFPSLVALDGLEQDWRWHPEGDALTHSLLAVAMLEEDAHWLTFIATLLHDVGKAVTTSLREDGRIISPGHAKEGADIAGRDLRRLGASNEEVKVVKFLVYEHMFPHRRGVTKKALRKRRSKLNDFWMRELFAVALADSGATLKTTKHLRDVRTWKLWKEIEVEPPVVKLPVDGHDIMKITGAKGVEIGKIKTRLMEMYLKNPEMTREEMLKCLPIGLELLPGG